MFNLHNTQNVFSLITHITPTVLASACVQCGELPFFDNEKKILVLAVLKYWRAPLLPSSTFDDRTEDRERSTTRLEFGPDGLGYTGKLLSGYFVKRRR